MPEQGVVVAPGSLVSDAARREVERIGAAIPEGKKGIFETWIAKQGAQASVGYRLNPVWDVGGWAGIATDGKWDFGARIRAVW